MSTTTTPIAVASVAPVAGRVRAYFAPVNRAAGTPTLFDPAQLGSFNLDTPPAPWVDLGWVSKFVRKCDTKVDSLRAGAPAVTVGQVRAEVDATVSLEFETWGRLQGTLASGSQQTNLLMTASGATANGSGGIAAAPIPLVTGSGPVSTATALNVGATAALGFSIGSLVAVDIDYTGQLGYVGTGVSAAYVQSATAVGSDVNYIRRVTLNIGVVIGINTGVLTLASLAACVGVPTEGMQVEFGWLAFCDREGASFFQEWSALFVLEGTQGDRILYHYPRLQTIRELSGDSSRTLAVPLEKHPTRPARSDAPCR